MFPFFAASRCGPNRQYTASTSSCAPCPDLQYLTDVMHDVTCRSYCIQEDTTTMATTTIATDTTTQPQNVYCYNVTTMENVTSIQGQTVYNQSNSANTTVWKNVTRCVVLFYSYGQFVILSLVGVCYFITGPIFTNSNRCLAHF